MSGMIFISPVIIHIYTITDHIISSGWGDFLKHQKITRTSNHFLCISPLLFTMALLFIFAFLPVYRGRCEDFTTAPCWGPGVCASGENKQKNAHCHCLLVRKIFVLIFSSCVLYKQQKKRWFLHGAKVIVFIQKSCFNIIQEYILYTRARQTGEISIACLLGAKCWARSLKIMLIGLETFIILSEEQTNFDTSSAGHWTSSSHPVLYCTVLCMKQGCILYLLFFCLYRRGKPIYDIS